MDNMLKLKIFKKYDKTCYHGFLLVDLLLNNLIENHLLLLFRYHTYIKNYQIMPKTTAEYFHVDSI